MEMRASASFFISSEHDQFPHRCYLFLILFASNLTPGHTSSAIRIMGTFHCNLRSIVDAGTSRESERNCMEKHLPRFLENGTTAIICNQDTLANAALIQCQQLGYQVPDDVSIIGFDDLPIAAYTSPPLTTIRQDRTELGKSNFFALSSLLNGVSISTFLLHAQLIERKSTGKAPVI